VAKVEQFRGLIASETLSTRLEVGVAGQDVDAVEVKVAKA
jgi:hypothetical protein